ncbi:MAG: hypothetical protein M3R24_37160 [Chloroflexota bacterium]|nr:hypothetical protein [Chloroflexota bacterium]
MIVEEAMESRGNRIRYFVRQLNQQDREWHEGYRFEVQLLDQDGKAAMVGHFIDAQQPMVLGQHNVPIPVLQAAQRREPGSGDYVNDQGQSIPWW